MQDLTVSGDTVVIGYKVLEYKFHKISDGERGEIQLKWDDAAQWFGVKRVAYRL